MQSPIICPIIWSRASISEIRTIRPQPRPPVTFSFTGGDNLSNQTVLLAWEHEHYSTADNILSSRAMAAAVPAPPLPWPADDYDTIWTVTLDAQGNLTVNNALCEGIDSAKLPATAPHF